MRLVLGGLESDSAGRDDEAIARYQRALQVDSTNPYAWLALARQEVFEGDPERALGYLDRANALLGSDERATAHVVGLRGAALVALGRPQVGEPFLEEARQLAPSIWGDGKLDADELR